MKIYLTGRNLQLEHSNENSLLTTLERNGIAHEYQCRAGYCGACRAKLKKGKVFYKEPPIAFLSQDEILLCCCQAEEDLEIEL
ncbi:class I ribonucleotide reductase maintenance protein YfaE [Pasteurellaceae bacterium LIM206]|nr:class I ribonucleotide reductase maintenance protein YfaE [Pasteurellaceae bacterium LIM206]